VSAPTTLAELEAAVERALASGDESGLEVLGYGEISCVLAWRDEAFSVAAKRLPLFDDRDRLAAYTAAFNAYLLELERAGVPVAPSRLDTTPAAGGRTAVWCLQPLLPPESLAPVRLAAADDGEARRLLGAVADCIRAAATPLLGIDGQLSNWAVAGDGVLYFDVTTPLMRDDTGREVLDLELFLASLPWALRGFVRRHYLRAILDKYYEPRGNLLDLLGNLIKEGLAARLGLALAVVNERVEPAIEEAEVRRYYREDAQMWALLQRLRRLDRWWQRRVRGRSYPFLLPGPVARHV
jgi:hypothetical protein